MLFTVLRQAFGEKRTARNAKDMKGIFAPFAVLFAVPFAV
jgi:hypothetical protein